MSAQSSSPRRSVPCLGPSPTPSRAISFEFLVWAPVLLFSIVAHEYAHAEAAYRQGDDTAYMLGRLTLNPLKHIDPLMTVIVPFLLWKIGAPPFGAATAVPAGARTAQGSLADSGRQFRGVSGSLSLGPAPANPATHDHPGFVVELEQFS